MEVKGAAKVSKDNVEYPAVFDPETQNRVKTDESNGTIQKEKKYSKEEINSELEHLNKWLESKNSHLKFVLHDKLNKYYVQVVNDATNEVIKEIPSKKMMDTVASFYEKLGILVDEKV